MSQLGGVADSQDEILEKIVDSEIVSPEAFKPRPNGKHFVFPEPSSERF
jgi:hypothetical protein